MPDSLFDLFKDRRAEEAQDKPNDSADQGPWKFTDCGTNGCPCCHSGQSLFRSLIFRTHSDEICVSAKLTAVLPQIAGSI